VNEVLAHSADSLAERIEFDVADEVLAALDRVEHIVVLMMENRSFDHMLGYLRLSGRRPELEGLKPEMENTYHDKGGKFPMYDGQSFPVHELPDTKMKKSQDPPHGGSEVDGQLDGADGENKGFVQVYMDKRGGPAEVHPNDVMGYHTEHHLPVYDHLSEKFLVCDHWFSSVPGATFPNRLYSVAGHADGKRDNISPPIYKLHSFVRHLDAAKVSWGWFSHDAAPILWAIDNEYPFDHLFNEHVAWFDGHWRPPHLTHTFIQRAAAGKLPSVSWIDPSFADFRHGVFRLLAPPSNDDHPPSDVLAGQNLVLKVYDALASSPAWKKTLLLITYDEHGGFFDHVPPPKNPPDDDPTTFSRYGARVPAIVVSPFVGQRSFSHELFDHASIIKTILLRFCRDATTIPNMGKRVSAAQNLGVLLGQPEPRSAETAEIYRPLADKIAAGRTEVVHDQLVFGATKRASTPTSPTDWQEDFLKIREGFMKQLINEKPEKLIKQVPDEPVAPL
jgi:phospholipase C